MGAFAAFVVANVVGALVIVTAVEGLVTALTRDGIAGIHAARIAVIAVRDGLFAESRQRIACRIHTGIQVVAKHRRIGATDAIFAHIPGALIAIAAVNR
jgi:hypothetical protein